MADMVPMNREYDSKSCAELTKQISEEIKSRMKLLGYRRYKLAVEVVVAQVMDQGIAVTSRSVWDNTQDSFATAVHETSHFITVATVFATYFE